MLARMAPEVWSNVDYIADLGARFGAKLGEAETRLDGGGRGAPA